MTITLHLHHAAGDHGRLLAHAERRLAFALGRFADRVRGVAITIEDINGPKGGDDLRAHLVVRLHGQADVVVQGVYGTASVAIDALAERARRTVQRHLARRRELLAG